jgi:hypothetical protein
MLCLFGLTAYGQTPPKKDSVWFKNLKIGQSMATSEQTALPAQFSITFPQHMPANFLVNAGISSDLGFSGKNDIFSLIAEYHRNTLTDSAQNNLQVGLKYTLNFDYSADNTANWIFIADPQYILDEVAKKHSLATDLLFSYRDNGTGFRWDANNIYNSTTFFVSLVGGTQVQQVFPSDTTEAKGFKLRPLLTGTLSYTFFRKQDATNPLITLAANYAQRVAVVNTTNDGEKWTHELNTSISYVLVANPVKVSLAASFITGADYFAGLKQQQYFLVSVNVLK